MSADECPHSILYGCSKDTQTHALHTPSLCRPAVLTDPPSLARAPSQPRFTQLNGFQLACVSGEKGWIGFVILEQEEEEGRQKMKGKSLLFDLLK